MNSVIFSSPSGVTMHKSLKGTGTTLDLFLYLLGCFDWLKKGTHVPDRCTLATVCVASTQLQTVYSSFMNLIAIAGNLKKQKKPKVIRKRDEIFNKAGFSLALRWMWKRGVLQTSRGYNRNKVWIPAEVASHETV